MGDRLEARGREAEVTKGQKLTAASCLMRAAHYFFTGQLKPVIDRTFPLSEAAAAHQRMEESSQFGKIVLEVH